MKNKALFLLLTLLASAWLPACKRDNGKTIISGTVTEYGTGKPLDSVKVYVQCSNSSFFGPQQQGNLIETLLTDNNGRFYREYIEKDFCNAAYLAFYKPGYYFKTDIDINTDGNNFDIVLDPEAWLKIITVPDGGIEHLFVAGNFWGGSGIEIYASEGVKERLFPTKGNREMIIRWGLWVQNGQVTQDTVYLPAHDTTTHIIHY